MALHCFTSCFTVPCKPKTNSTLLPQIQLSSLCFCKNLSENVAMQQGGFSTWGIKTVPHRFVVYEAGTTKKPNSAEKRARQAEKRRFRNKAHKSEIKTRMRKVFEALEALKKKSEAQAEEIVPIEKLIVEAYAAIDKVVQKGCTETLETAKVWCAELNG